MTKDTERYQMMVESICKEHDCLNEKQINQLGELLEEQFKTCSGDYHAVINFLHSTEEIDLATLLDLRDLA